MGGRACDSGGRGWNSAYKPRKPRIAGNPQGLEEARKDSSPETSYRAWPCPHLTFRFIFSRTESLDICCYKPPCLWYLVPAAPAADTLGIEAERPLDKSWDPPGCEDPVGLGVRGHKYSDLTPFSPRWAPRLSHKECLVWEAGDGFYFGNDELVE